MKLDVKNKRILAALESNSRASVQQIARDVELSTDSIAYRMLGLEKKGIITSYFGYVNFHKLGYMDYAAYLSFGNMDVVTKASFIETISKNQNVTYFSETGGRFNFIIGILAKDPLAFQTIFEELITPFIQYVHDKEIVIRLGLQMFGRVAFTGQHNTVHSHFGGEIERTELDALDSLIVSRLAKNAREKIVTIANEANVSANAIISRIKKLEKNEIITGYHASFDSSGFNYTTYNLLLKLSIATNQVRKQIESFCENNPNIIWCISTTGGWDFEVGVEVENPKRFQEIIDNLKDIIHQTIQIDFVTIFEQFKYNLFPFDVEKKKKI
jgi:Lrp/AsnC family leucine-responsive transcriptional regulator